jgi:hypothetical protein
MRWRNMSIQLVIACAVIFGAWVVPAEASTQPPDCSVIADGRCLYVGFFTGESLHHNANNPQGPGSPGDQGMLPQLYTYANLGTLGTWSIPQNVNSGASFVNFIHGYLFQSMTSCPINMPNPPADYAADMNTPYNAAGVGTCWSDRQEVLGATFMVLAMIGAPYTTNPAATFTGPNDLTTAIADAKADFNVWSADVLAADSARQVDWNMLYTDRTSHPDSHSLDYAHDIDLYPEAAQVNLKVIEFQNPGGTFVINKACGNVEGGLAPFASLDTSIQAGLGAIKDSGGAPATILIPGQKYTIYPTVTNTGPGTSSTVYLELQQPTGITITGVNAASAPYGVGSSVSGGGCVAGYAQVTVASSPPAACVGKHGEWQYTGIGGHSPTYTQTTTFTVNANASGTVCFQSDATPKSLLSLSSFTTSATVCLRVAPVSNPEVTGANSDVHAGGGICGQTLAPPSAGYIQGDPSSSSGDQYVVSATGGTGSFDSNELAPIKNNLTLGATGDYGEICREDLESAAQAYLTSGGQSGIVSGTVDIASLNPSDNVYFALAGTIHLSGTVTRKITIVMLNGGTVDINGNIQITGATSLAQTTPSLGVISDGNIVIDSNVSRVDAYLFSNGSIDTCAQSAQIPNPCTTDLLVNGFLMAHSIAFDRRGPQDATGTPVAEQIVLNPQIYLNPPTFFDSSVDDVLLQGQGEDQPLF